MSQSTPPAKKAKSSETAADQPNVQAEVDDEPRTRRFWTTPNILCLVRFFGSLLFIPFAFANWPVWILVLFLFLTATDWLDGKLAIAWKQRSTIGPHMDTGADMTMAAGLLFAALWSRGDVLLGEWVWIVGAVATYGLSCALSFIKFGKLPLYHNRLAKANWFWVILAAFGLFLDYSLWPLRVASVGVALANLEAMLITIVLPNWRMDVISLSKAMKIRRETI